MEIQIGKNPEYTIYLGADFHDWSFLFNFFGRTDFNCEYTKWGFFQIKFLCFNFTIEY